MSTITLANQLTMLEMVKRLNNGSLTTIAETMTKKNAILEDAPWLEANKKNSHQITERIYIPTGSKRKYNQGVAKVATATRQIIEPGMMVEAYSEPDVALALHSGNAAKFRADEDMGIIEGMSQSLALDMFYAGGAADEFKGLAPRLSGYDGVRCFDNAGGAASATANKTSIYLVGWGERSAFMFHPEGDQNCGIKHRDLGEVTVKDAAGGQYQAYRSHFQVHGGLAVKDHRNIKRICNISTSNIDGVDDFYLDMGFLRAAINEMDNLDGAVIYVNSTIMTQIEELADAKLNVHYSGENPWGKPQMHFRGIPIKLCRAISNNEATVSELA